MGFPATYCSICGGPFGNPYTELVSDIPNSKLLEERVENDFEVREWHHLADLGNSGNAELALNPEL